MSPQLLAAQVADLTVAALAEEDAAFRADHGPQHTWSPEELDAYEQLMAPLFATGPTQREAT